jgi:hypothetical protein
MTQHEVEMLMGVVGKRIKADVVEPLTRRLDALEGRLKEAEARAAESLRFRGAYQRALSLAYVRGDVVLHAGLTWACLSSNPQDAPGTGNGWQLLAVSKSHG